MFVPLPPEIFRPSAVSDTTTRCDFILFRRQKNPNMYRKIALISNFIKQIATFKAETICFFSDFQAHCYTTVWYKFCPFNQLQYSPAVNIAKLCCHWLKYFQKEKNSVVPSYNCATENRKEIRWSGLKHLRNFFFTCS